MWELERFFQLSPTHRYEIISSHVVLPQEKERKVQVDEFGRVATLDLTGGNQQSTVWHNPTNSVKVDSRLQGS